MDENKPIIPSDEDLRWANEHHGQRVIAELGETIEARAQLYWLAQARALIRRVMPAQ